MNAVLIKAAMLAPVAAVWALLQLSALKHGRAAIMEKVAPVIAPYKEVLSWEEVR